MFIQRDYTRTEDDDWKLNVQNCIQPNKESVEQFVGSKIIGQPPILVGWCIIDKYE